MASPKSVLSKTLQSITLSKIRELESRHRSYESRKRGYLDRADASADERDRLACLLDAVRELCPGAATDGALSNIERWLDQSRYDASVPVSKLVSFSRQLRGKLDIHSRRLDMALLYSRLLTEWMDQPDLEPSPVSVDDLGDDDSFEMIERQRQRLSELVDKFESVVFEPLVTDEAEIRRFLDRLFADDESQNALKKLRKTIAEDSARFMAEKAPFTLESVTSCIKGLLTEDILSDEKQSILRDFLDNDAAKCEIADVLNMRFADLKHWHWNAGKDGIRVMPRRGLNGKYRVWADDDILQMIFVQYIGVKLCNILKPALKDLMWAFCPPGEFGIDRLPDPTERDRRRYYVGQHFLPIRVTDWRERVYFNTFLLAQLPGTESSLFKGLQYDGDGGGDGIHEDDDNDGDYDGKDASDGVQRKPSGIKQRLLRHLTTELIIHRLTGVTYDTRDSPGGSVALIQTDLQWYATGLPHSTIFAAMRYVGFDQAWIDFFQKYLEAPLNLDAASDDRVQRGPRIRKRGVPMAHASEKLTGELVLFFMDVAVFRETGIPLYRLHDDIWVLGKPEKTAQAWTCMQSFARVFGLEFNQSKTGSVYLPGASKRNDSVAKTLPPGPVSIGFLRLDPESGKWRINQKLVAAHVDQLKTQLAECKSVLSWVQTWNSCIGRFFSHTFGEPAYCFGRDHVNEVLDTYRNILQRLFPDSGGNVVEHVKRMIEGRFGVSGLPDAFVYLPEQLGGLGLRNPFVNLFLIRNKLTETPEDIVNEYLRIEREEYLNAKRRFEGHDDRLLHRRLTDIWPEGESSGKAPPIPPSERRTFFSLDEYSRFRQKEDGAFLATVKKLASVPETEELSLSKDVERELEGFLADSVRLDAGKKWPLQLYEKELLEEFGGLNLVDKQFLPGGVLEIMRGKKVSWNMVL